MREIADIDELPIDLSAREPRRIAQFVRRDGVRWNSIRYDRHGLNERANDIVILRPNLNGTLDLVDPVAKGAVITAYPAEDTQLNTPIDLTSLHIHAMQSDRPVMRIQYADCHGADPDVVVCVVPVPYGAGIEEVTTIMHHLSAAFSAAYNKIVNPKTND